MLRSLGRGIFTAILIPFFLGPQVVARSSQPAESQIPRGSKPEQQIQAIENYCEAVAQFSSEHKKDALVFGAVTVNDVPGAINRRTEWRRFPSEEDLSAFFESTTAGDAAFVWVREGSVVAANFTLQDVSGDWVTYANYCFGRDGRLARIHSTYNTFYGDMSVVRDQWFGASGRAIRSQTQYLDLTTRKPKKPEKTLAEQRVALYARTTDLPFAKLLRAFPGPR